MSVLITGAGLVGSQIARLEQEAGRTPVLFDVAPRLDALADFVDLDKAVIVRRCPVCSGVSRTIKTSRRRSLRTTSADRVSSVVVTPVAISDIVRIEQGATTMPIVLNEPLEMEAAMSSTLCH